MATQSLDNFEEQLEVLAKQAVYNGEYRRLQKAGALPDALKAFGTSALSHLKSSPTLSSGLLGAGLGGAYGAATSYANEDESRSPLRSAITGALAGGAVGAGAGLTGSSLAKYMKNRDKSPAPAIGVFTQNGRKYELKPGAESILPEVTKLESRSPVTRGVGAVTDSIWGYAKNHPLLATIMAGDAATHAIGTGAEMTSAGRGGGATLEHFRKGLAAMEKNKDTFVDEDKITAIKKWLEARGNNAGDFHKNYTEAVRTGSGFTHTIPGKIDKKTGKPGKPKIINVLSRDLQDIGRAGTGVVRPGGGRSIADIWHSFKGTSSKSPMRMTAYDKTLPGWWQKTLQRLSATPRPTSLAARVGGRAALYGGLPALQWYAGQSLAESRARSQLNRLMQQYAVPAGQ